MAGDLAVVFHAEFLPALRCGGAGEHPLLEGAPAGVLEAGGVLGGVAGGDRDVFAPFEFSPGLAAAAVGRRDDDPGGADPDRSRHVLDDQLHVAELCQLVDPEPAEVRRLPSEHPDVLLGLGRDEVDHCAVGEADLFEVVASRRLSERGVVEDSRGWEHHADAGLVERLGDDRSLVWAAALHARRRLPHVIGGVPGRAVRLPGVSAGGVEPDPSVGPVVRWDLVWVGGERCQLEAGSWSRCWLGGGDTREVPHRRRRPPGGSVCHSTS